MKAHLINFGIAAATIVSVLIILEIARQRGVDPVNRVAAMFPAPLPPATTA
jgi:hypothetical protein